MLYYLTAAGLIAHTFFWGLGLAWLATPRRWRRWWWAFAPGFGLALQSAVVWAGAHTTMAGTAVYARASELIPLALLAVVLGNRAARPRWLASLRSRAWPGLAAVMLATGAMLLWPMTQPGRGLTTSSLGSCDQADYAAGARVFQEFSRDDRAGFLGLPEVTKVRSADYFFDFWLRLNHFTPPALLAHNAAVFGVESYRLVSVTAAALVLLNLPLVFFLARFLTGLRGAWLAGLAALYGLAPLNAYAVHHGALGQLYAAQGIALLTVALVGAGQAAGRREKLGPYFAPVLAAFWLLAGSYNFILVACLAPVAAWLLLQLVVRRDGRAAGRVLGLTVAALAVCAGLFWGRFEGLIERFSLFEQYNFGWAVPLFSPEGWLGLFRDTSLHGWTLPVRATLSAGLLALWLAAFAWWWRRNRDRALLAVALVVPVVAGWGILAWESRVRANASYDAYKIIAVFYPGLLAGLCVWLAAAARAGRTVRWAAGGLFGLLLAANLSVAFDFCGRMASPPLRVDRTLAELGRLEADPTVTSLNMVIDDYWSRLWANAFLLRKPQYFAVHTYEGRLDTALKGEWNLSDSLLNLVPLRAEDYRVFNARFHLVRAAAPGRVDAAFLDGWYAEEKAGTDRWRWSDGHGRILLTNPADRPVRAVLRLRIRAFSPRLLTVRLEQHAVATGRLDGELQELVAEDVLLQPGPTLLTLASDRPAAGPGGADERSLDVALYGFELRTLAAGN